MNQALGLGRSLFRSFDTSRRNADVDKPVESPSTAQPQDADPVSPAPERPVIRRGAGRNERRLQRQRQQQLRPAWNTPPPSEIDGQIKPGKLGSVPTEGRAIGQDGKGQQPVGGPGKGGKGEVGGPKMGGVLDESGRDFAQLALRRGKPPAAGQPYAQHKAQVRSDLEQLGLIRPGTGRVHIDDVDGSHGAAVTRAAVGPTSLAQGAQTSLSINGVPQELRDARRTEAQRQRLDDIPDRIGQLERGELGSDDVVQLTADRLEGTLLNHGDAVAHVRGQLPADGKDTFMNMSWGQSPDRILNQSTGRMLMAPEGSAAYKEVEKLLGHPPTRTPLPSGGTELKKEEFQAVRGHLLTKLDPILQSESHQNRMTTARGALETELAAGREQGLLVFAAAGNEHASATRMSRPDLAQSTASGAKGLILVGATDPGGPGTEDDAVAEFSNQGRIIVSAAGVDIPVGESAPPPLFANLGGTPNPLGPIISPNEHPTDVEGTSFASPIALEAAYLADSINPELNVNQIEALLTDPRAVHDIAGTDRDGAGQIDHFAVALLSANPKLTRAQIDHAQTVLRSDPSAKQLAALKAQLGL